MKSRLTLIIFIFLNGYFAFSQNIPERPVPPRLVNDYVGMLSEGEVMALENKLVAYNDTTSTQIVIAVVNTTQPYDIADYALQLGRKWGVGQKGKNNGIVILWATDDRRIDIETGYGMEGAVPDIVAKRIIDRIMAPAFRDGMYYKGLDETTSAIIKYAEGEHKAEAAGDEISLFEILFFILFFGFIFYIIVSIFRKGGGGPGSGGRRIYDSSDWPYTTYTGWGRQSGHWGGGMGGFGGGPGGGGFGGFGGGSFGGGGASGSY